MTTHSTWITNWGRGKPAGYYVLMLLINIAIKSLSLWFGMGSLHFGCDLGG